MSETRWNAPKAFVCINFVVLLFQSPLSRSSLPAPLPAFFGWYDELTAGALFIALIVYAAKRGIPKEYLKDVALFLLFLGIGFVGTALNDIQPLPAVFEDVVSCSKFVMALYGVRVLFRSTGAEEVLKSLERISYALIAILFALTIIDEIFPNKLFESGGGGSGLHAVQLFYYHPSVLAQASAMLLAVISIRPSKRNYGYRAMALAILLATLTSKALGFVFLYLFVCGYGKMKSGPAKAAIALCAILCVAFVASSTLDEYYGNEASARYTLTVDSIEIANENAPIGLGFATFGSAAAASHYSPVYIGLGYLAHYGLGYASTSYLTDTFWPALFAEFGYLGTLAYAGIILLILKRCVSLFATDRNSGVGALSIMGYLLISSSAATAFFNPISVSNAMMLGLSFSLAAPITLTDPVEARRHKPIRGARYERKGVQR